MRWRIHTRQKVNFDDFWLFTRQFSVSRFVRSTAHSRFENASHYPAARRFSNWALARKAGGIKIRPAPSQVTGSALEK